MLNNLLILVCASLLLAPCALAADAVAPQVPQTPVKDKWAIVVGISEFANNSLNLKYADKDARDFAQFLVKECNFAPDHVKLVVNKEATKNKILDLLGDSWLPRVALPDDLVVIFISSHGSPSEMDVCGVNYVVAHDSDPDKLFTTALPIQQLAATIKDRVHSNRVLLILDACHSGGASDSKGLARVGNVDASALAQGTGHMVICSSSKTEASWESKSYPNGVFTYTLMEALRKDGKKTKLADAFTFLKDNVQQQVARERGQIQTPVLEMSKWQGKDLILAAVPASPRPGLAELKTPERQIAAVTTAAVPPVVVPTTSVSPGTGTGSASIPSVAGAWIGSDPNQMGLKIFVRQSGKNVQVRLPRTKEICNGSISDDGKQISWMGRFSKLCTATLECDGAGQVVKLVGPNGQAMVRAAAGELVFPRKVMPMARRPGGRRQPF